MRLSDYLDRNHGFTTREDLRRVGLSPYAIRRLIDSGRLVAFTRNVLGRPNVNAAFRRAVQMNSRAACVTAAQGYGVWVLEDSGFHVVTRSPGGKFRLDGHRPVATRHWTPEPIEPDHQLVAVESLRNALAHLARCQPLDAAVASFDSAVRLGFTSVEELQRLASVHHGRLSEVVPLVTGRADSGLETLTRVRLGWAGIACREQVVIDGHPVDLLIGDRLVIQLDGKQHLEDPVQLARDRVQDRWLQQMGYTVLRFGYAEVVFGWDEVLAQIQALLASRAHQGL